MPYFGSYKVIFLLSFFNECDKLIRHLYETTDTSQRKLATQFGVSRRLIQFILDPEKQKANLQAREDSGGSKQYYNKETHTKTMKAHRSYKKALYDASLLKAPDIKDI